MKVEKRKVNIFADSTCDLAPEQIKEYEIQIIPLCILLDEKSYYDGEELLPDEIYRWADANKKTPKTAAITPEYTQKAIAPFMNADEDIIFFGISEEMSTTCNVMRLAAEEFDKGRVFVIDSENLSTGIGLQVLRAAEYAKNGMEAEEIVKRIEEDRGKVRASFVVDTLVYLARGGRCSGATALLASALKLHPCINVINGKMEVGNKYRGSLLKAVMKYAADKEKELLSAREEIVFITHSGIEEGIIEKVREYLSSLQHFDRIVVTRAGGVISSHCGPGTLGILYYLK